MRRLALTLTGVLLVILLATLWHRLPIDRACPDLWAIFAIYFGLHTVDGELIAPTLAGALVVGLTTDLLAGMASGLYGFSAVVLALLARILARRILLRGRAATAVAGALASVIGMVLSLSVFVVMEVATPPVLSLLWILVAQSTLTALCAPPVFAILRRVEARTSRLRARDLAREGMLR